MSVRFASDPKRRTLPWAADVSIKLPSGREIRRRKWGRTKEEAEEFERQLRAEIIEADRSAR
jgi:hypothetical protein